MSRKHTVSTPAARIVLRPPSDRDFSILSKLRNDLEVQDSLLALGRPNSPRRVRAWLERRAEETTGAFFVIADAHDDRAIGFVQARGIDSLHRIAELGICISRDDRGRGLGREAIALLEKYLSRVFRIRKIWLRVDASNAPAVALYRSSGFREVGTLKHYAGGRYRDILLMERLFRDGKAGKV
jgi:RimJ/RimL family protein N-acetyltransferase